MRNLLNINLFFLSFSWLLACQGPEAPTAPTPNNHYQVDEKDGSEDEPDTTDTSDQRDSSQSGDRNRGRDQAGRDDQTGGSDETRDPPPRPTGEGDHVTDPQPVVAQDEITLGAFNLLRLGQNDKDLDRMVQLIIDSDYDLFAAVEIMDKESADELLEALIDQSGLDWVMNISERSTGEYSYREYLAFYYRADRVEPYISTTSFCKSTYSQTRNASACYAKDYRNNGQPDFEREPYVGHFKFHNQVISIAAVHLYYGGLDAEAVERRRREMRSLERVMQEIEDSTPGSNIFAVGDFNLTIGDNEGRAEISEQVPESFYYQGNAEVIGLIDGPTTTGFSNYDHIFYYDTNRLNMVEDSATTIIDFYLNSRSQRNEYRDEVSDHYPVKATFANY